MKNTSLYTFPFASFGDPLVAYGQIFFPKKWVVSDSSEEHLFYFSDIDVLFLKSLTQGGNWALKDNYGIKQKKEILKHYKHEGCCCIFAHLKLYISLFHPIGLFLYPLKMPENLDVYRKEVQKETGGMGWINKATMVWLLWCDNGYC